MSKEEEAPARVTRSALRRMSLEQEPASAPGTPKKTTASTKKSAILDAIQEGSTGTSDADEDSSARTTTKGKKDTSFVGNKSLLKIKEQEVSRPPLRSRAASLTEDNVSVLESAGEVRRTPRRRASQDLTVTPQTGPTVTRRKTRRNSTTSDDGNVPATTPKASKSRLSVAPPTIAEDDEKEDKINTSVPTAEAGLSELDTMELRNRSISKSPVPKSSPSGKNTSIGLQKTVEDEGDTLKIPSPSKETREPTVNESVSEVFSVSGESVDNTPTKRNDSKGILPSPIGSVKKLQRDVTFEENTPKESDKSVYPKTPIAPLGEKRRKPSAKYSDDVSVVLSVTTDEVDETIHESPQKSVKATASPKNSSPTKTPKKADPSLDKSIDASIANIVEDVRENIDQIDQSMSILGTPKPIGEQKSHFTHLRKGTFSTPIAKLQEVEEENETPKSTSSKSWTQAVKGTSDKGIDVFSVRKQEEEKQQEEQSKKLNESLKKKSSPKKINHEDEDDDEEEDDDDEEPERNSFVDDEAMEVDGYESGDSKDSAVQAELDENVEDEGESIGSQDSEMEEEEDENDSFVVSDNDECELLDGSGDDLGSDAEEDKSQSKTKRKRIIQQSDSSDDEQAISLDDTTVSENKLVKKTPKKEESDKSSSPKKTPSKNETPKKTPVKNSPDETTDVSTASVTSGHSKSPKKAVMKSVPETNIGSPNKTNSKTPNKTPCKTPSDEDKKPEQSLESSNAPLFADQSMSPKKAHRENTPVKTPVRNSNKTDFKEKSVTPKSQTPSNIPSRDKTEQPATTENKSSIVMEISMTAEQSDNVKSRKSLPAPALVSADFYTSAKKAAKRNTIHVLDVENPAEQETEEPTKSANLVTNPAALALAKKNKRLSLGASPVDSALKRDKRASLPGKLPEDKEVESPLKKKKKNVDTKESETVPDAVEPMEVDECDDDDDVEESPVKQPAPQAKKKPKDLSEFDTSAILARCNEIVRSDKEKRKQGATLKQKKKDEKRRQREEEEQQDQEADANESPEQKKKKKKKKKPVNYLLEELGETKADQVAKALQRKMAILEAKRERKKAKKAAKLQQQLNKENEQGEEEKKAGIGAKFEKKIKKDKKAKKEQKASVEKEPAPLVKRAISAFAIYSAQIEELKANQTGKKKSKSKQLKEKNQSVSAVEEVHEALKAQKEIKSKKDKPTSDQTHNKDKQKVQREKEDVKPPKQDHKKKEKETSSQPETKNPLKPATKSNDKDSQLEKNPKLTKKSKSSVPPCETLEKKTKLLSVPLKTVTTNDDLDLLKKSLSEPVSKVVKKQKLSQNESNLTAASFAESTPPRKLKALTRLEQGFIEESLTPEHKLLKRNHGFKEEPVTPKTIGFKVSNLLPAGQEALQQQALLAKKRKTFSDSKRIRPEDVKEPAKGLPLPIWTRSGVFEVEELSNGAQSKKSKSLKSEIIPLDAPGTGKCSTEFMVKGLGIKDKEHRLIEASSKPHRTDRALVDESVLNFKKDAIFGKNAHLREKKSKH